jgi:hypothetical protein
VLSGLLISHGKVFSRILPTAFIGEDFAERTAERRVASAPVRCAYRKPGASEEHHIPFFKLPQQKLHLLRFDVDGHVSRTDFNIPPRTSGRAGSQLPRYVRRRNCRGNAYVIMMVPEPAGNLAIPRNYGYAAPSLV